MAGVTGVNLWRVNQLGLALVQSDELRVLAEQEQAKTAQANETSRRLLYASRMRNAQQSWREGRYSQVQDLLNRYADGTPDADLRHFEWYHLNYLCHVPHRVLGGHEGEVYAVAYSPDERFLLSGGQDGTVRIWEAATGNQVAVLKEHTRCVNSIDFAPDGDTFVTASCDKTIKLWSLSRREVIRTLTNHTLEVDSCQFVDEGRLLISVSRGEPHHQGPLPKEAIIWDMKSGNVRTDWPPPGEKIHWLAWAQSGQTLVTNADGIATVWKRNGETWTASQQFGGMDPWGGFISPDEKYLLVPHWPNQMRTFDLSDGQLINQQDAHRWVARCVCFSPSGKLYATCAESVRLWDYPSGIPQFRFGSLTEVWRVAWPTSERSIAAACTDGVHVWELKLGKPNVYLEPKAVDAGPIHSFAYLHDGEHVSVMYSGQSATWNLMTGQSVPNGQLLSKVQTSKQETSNNLTYSVDGQRSARFVNGGIAICDAETGEETLRLDADVPGARQIVFAPDGTSLIAHFPPYSGLYYWPGMR